MTETPNRSPSEEVRRIYEDAETRTAQAVERIVGRESFGELLAMVTENVVALTRMGNDALDRLPRNLRLAGRQDITRLARQLARTEDKLERVLQEIEALRDELAAERGPPAKRNGAPRSQPARPARSS